MKRGIVWLGVAAGLLAVAVVTEIQLESIPREDPLGRELLYLPSAQLLRAASLGNPGLAADVTYLWSIQYYSQFEPSARLLYLEKVYDLITDLDPHYFDAYWIGAMVMLTQPQVSEEARKASVVELYDKGIAAMPDDSRLAEIAAWDMRTAFDDTTLAIRYMRSAAAAPDAPNRLKRVLGRWLDTSHRWSIHDSIRYWTEVYQEAPTHQEKLFGISHLLDIVAGVHHRQLDPLLAAAQTHTGSCPKTWQPLLEHGVLAEEPVDLMGRVYPIDPATCTIRPIRNVRVKPPDELVIHWYGPLDGESQPAGPGMGGSQSGSSSSDAST